MIEKTLKDKLLQRTQLVLNAVAGDVLTRDVLSCDYNDLAAKAARMILEYKHLGILILKEGTPFNMITAFDLLRLSYEKVFQPERDFLRIKVGDVVAEKEFIHIPSDTKIYEVLNLMLEKQVRSLPVIDANQLVGMCSMRDLIYWYRKTHNEMRTGKLEN